MRIFNQLRRLMVARQKVREYVVYASGEVFLIVVGILIAIQLNNWNQSISTADQKLDMLGVLKQNFQLNEQEIRATLDDYEGALRITSVRIASTGPGVTEVNDSIIAQVRQIDKVKMSLVQGASTASLMQFQNVSLLSNEIRDLLLVYSAAYEQYKSSEQNVDELTMKLRQNHQKFVALLTESADTDSIPADAAHLFSSDYLGWLRDRDHQNLAVESRWKIEQSVERLEHLLHLNESLLAKIKQELREGQRGDVRAGVLGR